MTPHPSLDWTALAHAVLDGTAVRRGDRVALSLTGIEAYPAAREIARLCHGRGAVVQLVLSPEDIARDARRLADADVLGTPAALELAAIEWADVYVSLRPMQPPETGADPADPASLAAQRRAQGAVSAARWGVSRWQVVRIPTVAWAELAGVDPALLFAQFSAGIDPTPADRARWEQAAAALAGTRTVRILDEDTDLMLPCAGRPWVLFAGTANLPDGEVATAPWHEQVSGHLTVPGPCFFADTRISGLRLRFEAGRCVEVRADEGERQARAIVEADDGAAFVGELGIGVNAGMRTLVGDLFHDEKVLGTVHIALGRAYPECGGANRSSIHWDIVKDLRTPHGQLLVDDVAVIRGGIPHPPLTGRP